MNDYLNNLARNDDEKRLIARLIELTRKAAHGQYGQSDFMDLRQQELARVVGAATADIRWYLDGGYEQAERKRFIVYPEWETEVSARIAYLKVSHKKFKDQSIGHRDYLGAVLNLGIKREKLGDIVVQDDKAFLIVDIDLAAFICQQLSRVKNSSVEVEQITKPEFVFIPPDLTTIQATLASLRIDAAVAAAFGLARSVAENMIQAGSVKLNQLEIYKGSTPVNAGDLVSVHGQGRFRIDKIGAISRKGRYHVEISRW